MADHIPFIFGDESIRLVNRIYSDSEIIRVPLYRGKELCKSLLPKMKLWLDPCIDGMDDLTIRRPRPGKSNNWFNFMSDLPNFERICSPEFHANPIKPELTNFVKTVLDKCFEYKPAWITVPQFPLVETSDRNRINRELAEATAKWKIDRHFSGHLILPLIFTHQNQVNGKTARNPKVRQAERCYHLAQADGFWVVDSSLNDDSGSFTLRNKRFPGMIDLHEELNALIPSRIRIAGPYWGLNLVLWSRGLIEYPAIGIGSGYQYLMAGGHTKKPNVRLALPPLRRLVDAHPQFSRWLDQAINRLDPLHPASKEFMDIKSKYMMLSEIDLAKQQVAIFYKKWFDSIADIPQGGRSMALFQDLAAAYALGKTLPDLTKSGTDRRPEAVAEALMLISL
jgi:hypothetical protein